MPTLYDYLGITIKFYTNEHYPIHVHAIYGNAEIKVTFFLEDGKIYRTTYSIIKGGFPSNKLNELKKFISAYKIEIINAWTDYFIWQKQIKPQKITKRI